MEPYPKRQRIFASSHRDFSRSFHNQHAYYDDAMDELEGDNYEADFLDDEEEDEELEEEEDENTYQPEEQLQQKRAQLDYKLKSTFEAIFEKYGQDFEGVGDEIDLETGEIMVNNGHLLEMQNERDAGDTTRFARNMVEDYSEDPTDTEDIPSSSLEETEALEYDDDEEELMSEDGDMMEDDLILRGFAKANRFTQASPELGPSRLAIPRKEPRQPAVSHSSMHRSTLPSRTDILAQFGPQLGPQILKVVSKQQVPDDSHIEPAWRVPELPKVVSKQLPPRQVFLEPEIERSPSPEAMNSIWAPVRTRVRRRTEGRDSTSMFREESMVPSHKLKPLNPFRRRSLNDFGLPPESMPKAIKQAKRVRINFTDDDDKIMLDWVARGRARGQNLWGLPLWRELEAKHPRHSAVSWRSHYKRCFTYLEPSDHVDGSDSETSIDTHILENRAFEQSRAGAASNVQIHPTSGRPTRIRKPAQRDSRIISWTEAVDRIPLLDPDLHAGMVEDTRMMNGYKHAFDYPGSFKDQSRSFSANRPVTNQAINTYTPQRASGRSSIDPVNAEYDELGSMAVAASLSPEQSTFRAPCPHADCRPYETIMYRLQRLENEDLSEMCLHLFRVHHTTPFPCGEMDCGRKGEEGYFMQADLVKHVRISHPKSGALHRLRGRVDDELLELPLKFIASVPLNDRIVGQARDSDFMSPLKRFNPRVASSSRPFSSSSYLDRTPRGTTAMLGASTSTPMTNVSSLKVHHSSGTIVPTREVSESHSLRSEEGTADGISSSGRAAQVAGEQSSVLDYGKQRTPTIRQPLVQGPLLSRIDTGRNALPTPTWESPRFEPKRPIELNEAEHFSIIEPEASTNTQPPRMVPSPNERATGPNQSTLQKTIQARKSQAEVSSSSTAQPKNQLAVPRGPEPQSFSRNTVDSSYEFSDEEGGVEPVTKMSPLKLNAVAQPATNTPATNHSAKKLPATVPPIRKPSLVTPAARATRKPKAATDQPAAETFVNKRKALLQSVMDSDFDELSLNANDFVFLFSRQLTTAGTSSEVQVKEEEETMSTPKTMPTLPSTAKNKKRNFTMFRDEEDELCVITPSSEIKVEEVDDTTLPLPKSTQRATKKRKISDPQLEGSSSKAKPSSVRRLAKNLPIRTGTPLLDLTPSRSKTEDDIYEIQDSVGEATSPLVQCSPSNPRNRTRAQRGAAGTSSPLVGLLTPVRKKRWSGGDPLRGEQVDIVVQTPGGTLRRCGEDDFECRKSFCFSCGGEK